VGKMVSLRQIVANFRVMKKNFVGGVVNVAKFQACGWVWLGVARMATHQPDLPDAPHIATQM
jgi:hypothetical protein